jgi:MraZ protein
MFLGQYEHTIDEKGRLTIPVRFRAPLEGGAYVTQGFDQNLIILTADSFQQMYERVKDLSVTDPTSRMLRRLIFSNADRVEVDRAGRILIPQFLRQATGLEGSAVVVGAGEYFEIWSPARWAEQNRKLQESEANAQRFAALELPIR